jgi:hypothetical protein
VDGGYSATFSNIFLALVFPALRYFPSRPTAANAHRRAAEFECIDVRNNMKSFDEKYPYIAAWVRDGTIEIGYNDYDDVFLRVIDPGGVVWESNKAYSNLDDAFAEMNAAIKTWCTENGIDLEL